MNKLKPDSSSKHGLLASKGIPLYDRFFDALTGEFTSLEKFVPGTLTSGPVATKRLGFSDDDCLKQLRASVKRRVEKNQI